MLAENQKVTCVDDCSAMQTLSSRRLPELIEIFELKLKQQKDVPQVRSKAGKPAAKMKSREPQEVLELVRLKLLISEMREKTGRMEAQLKSASEKQSKESRNPDFTEKNDMQAMENKISDRGLSILTNGNLQDLYEIETTELSTEQLKPDKDVSHLLACMRSLQQDVKVMLLELSSSPDLQQELATTKRRIKDLQEKIKDDAGTTKAQLLLLKQQFGELEKANNASEQRKLEFHNVCQTLTALEAEKEVFKKGNQELLTQTQEMSQKLKEEMEKAEAIVPVTEADVLASRAEVLKQRSTNAELQKKVESLQISRFNEVEEVVYLRWVNACLRHELDIYKCSHEDEISNQTENCTRATRGKDDSPVCGSLGHSVVYNKDGENAQEQNQCAIPHVPQNPGHGSYGCSSAPSSRHNQNSIKISTLTIPHGHVSGNHTSPLTSPVGQGEDNEARTSASPSEHVCGSPLSMVENTHGFPKNSHASPQNHVQEGLKRNSNLVDSLQQQLPSNNHSPQSPHEVNPQHSNAMLQSGSQKVADIQPGPTFNGNRPSKLDVTTYITVLPHSSPRRLGRSFARSSSNLSASLEVSGSQAPGSPQVHDKRGCMRSPSSLFAESDITSANRTLYTNSLSRRHSSSSVAEPPKRDDSTFVKAHSLESQLDDSDRIVAAFRRLSVSSQTPHRHRTFKELSRQSSSIEKEENRVQQSGRHDTQLSPTKSTRPDFIWDLARAIEATHYSSIEQVSAFVNWFDRQDETDKKQCLKFPDFPVDKVEAMRRAVYENDELQALEVELRMFKNNLKSAIDLAIQNMSTLLEKVENHIEGFKQARVLAIVQFKELNIPTDWMLDSGAISKIKRAALQLAQACIKEVTNVLTKQSECTQVSRDDLLLNAAKFLLEVHNFTGGFDEKTTKAFEILQSQVDIQNDNEIQHTMPS